MTKIRWSNGHDRAAILALAGEVFGAEPAAQLQREWQWQWHDNPHLSTAGHVGALLESDGQLVASTALQPAGLFIEGQPAEAWWSVNTMVHRSHRRRGIAAQLFDFMHRERPSAHVFGKGISAPALPMLKKCGFALLDTGGYWQRTLSVAPRLARHTGKTLAKVLALVGDLSVPRVPPLAPKVAVHEGAFDARFDSLWQRAAPSYHAIAVRDAAALQWRYRQHPAETFRVLTYRDDGQLRGYVVFRLYERRRCLRARVCDVLSERGDTTARDALLGAAMHSARAAGADRIDCFATGTDLQDSLQRLGFARSRGNEPLAVRGTTIEGLHVTAGDGDGG